VKYFSFVFHRIVAAFFLFKSSARPPLLATSPFAKQLTLTKIAILAISFAVVLTTVWAMHTFYHSFPPERGSSWGWVAALWHYPWTDMVENIIIGFNLANGLRFEHETVVTHMPGIYQYLSVFFGLFKIDTATPSARLIPLAVATAAFAITLFEFACTYIALRIVEIERGWAFFISSLFLSCTLFFFSMNLPLSENVIPFILLVQFACLHKIMDQERPLAYRLQLASWSLSFLPLINLLAGLTLAPGVAFLWCVVFVVTFNLIKREWNLVRILPRTPILLPIALTVALLGFEATTLDLKALWFWNIEVNKGNILVPPYRMISESLYIQLQHITDPRLPGGNLWDTMAFSGFFYAIRKKLGSLRKEDIYFLYIGFVFALLANWRANNGFKTEAISSITYYLFFALIPSFWPRIINKDINIPVKTVATLGIVASLFALHFFWEPVRSHIHDIPARPAALDIANVCRFRSTTPCRCLQITSFSPQSFLGQDIRQCRDRFSSFAKAIFRNDEIRDNLINDFERNDVAFLVFPENELEIDDVNRTSRIIYMLYGGGLHCIPYAGNAKICYKDAK